MKKKIITKLILLILCFSSLSSFGQSYNFVQMTNPDTLLSDLLSVWGPDNNNIFAVGQNGTILRSDGASWNLMTSPTNECFFDVWGTSVNDVWACGSNSILLHYGGNVWTPVTINGASGNFRCILGFNQNDIYLCGEYGQLYHYDGGSWTKINNAFTSDVSFHGMFGFSGNDLYIIGNTTISGYLGKLLYYNGDSIIEKKDIPDFVVYSIWSPDNNIFYIGGTSAIYTYNKINDSLSTVYTQVFNTALYGFNANLIINGGPDGHIALYNNGNWQNIGSGIYGIYSIFSPDTNVNNIYLVGVEGIILHLSIDTITSIETNNSINELGYFQVYPNPATEKITIIFPDKATINILNINGQIIKSIFSNSNSTTVDLTGLSRGVYIVRVWTDKAIVTRKFIKQ